MQQLKVFYPEPTHLGPSIRRRQRKLLELKPPMIIPVEDPAQADLQIQSICLAKEVELIRHSKFILYCHNAPALLGDGPEQLYPALGQALAVMSWADFPAAVKTPYKFFRLPQGADPGVFTYYRGPRFNAVATTGFLGTCYDDKGVVQGEPILEAHKAARRQNKTALQIGPDIEGVMKATGFTEKDEEVAAHYATCKYVSGMRWHGGFECPSLEGLLCGCRPICFDLPDERFWWGDHAIFVQHDPRTLVNELSEVLVKEPEGVTYAERDYIARKFDWKNIAKTFWALVLELA